MAQWNNLRRMRQLEIEIHKTSLTIDQKKRLLSHDVDRLKQYARPEVIASDVLRWINERHQSSEQAETTHESPEKNLKNEGSPSRPIPSESEEEPSSSHLLEHAVAFFGSLITTGLLVSQSN